MQYAKYLDVRQRQQEHKRELDELLLLCEQAGFQTNKGSNTHTLAGIMVDYIHKVIDKRKLDLSILSLWDSQDLNAMVPMLFWRYRIYNLRHHPALYDTTVLTQGEEPELFEELRNYSKLVYVGEGRAALATLKKIQIHQLSNETPTPLGIDYKDLLSGSRLVTTSSEGLVFKESTMSVSGVYNEGDYVIIPDEKGQAVFFPITNFKQHTNKPLTLSLLTRSKYTQEDLIAFNKVKDEVEITPELLRFTLTQLMGNFPTFRGMSGEEIESYLSLKYNKSVVYYEGVIFAELSEVELQEAREFSETNAYQTTPVYPCHYAYVSLEMNNYELKHKLIRYLNENIKEFYTREGARASLYSLVDQWYAVEFGLDGVKAKLQHPCSITVTYSDETANKSEISEISEISDKQVYRVLV